MGKATAVQGDSLAGFVPNLTLQQRQAFLSDPLGNAAPLLGLATTRIIYDLEHYLRTQQPVFAAVLRAKRTPVIPCRPADSRCR